MTGLDISWPQQFNKLCIGKTWTALIQLHYKLKKQQFAPYEPNFQGTLCIVIIRATKWLL